MHWDGVLREIMIPIEVNRTCFGVANTFDIEMRPESGHYVKNAVLLPRPASCIRLPIITGTCLSVLMVCWVLCSSAYISYNL